MYNLAFVPQNNKLTEALKRKFYFNQIDQLEAAFLELHYGEMLSKEIANCANNEIEWYAGHVTTIAEAQMILLRRWNNFNHHSMEAFALKRKKGPMRYIRPGHNVLVLKEDKLIMAKNTRKIIWSIGTGFQGYVNANFGISSKDFMEESEVHSVLDAAEHIFGASNLILLKTAPSLQNFQPILE